VRDVIERPIIVNGDPLTIPVEIAVGPNWATLEVQQNDR